MARSFRKSGERAEVLKDMAKAYMDYSIKTPQALLARYKELKAKDDKLEKEEADIDAKVKKIQEEHKESFKR